MKRMTKLFTALALALGLTTAAQAYTSARVISMNFGNQGAAPDSAGIVPVSAAAWNNVTAKANTRTDLKTWNGTEATTLSPNWSITWSAGDVWSSGDTDIILKGYLDDTDAVANQATATFNNIPFEYYDIYIYKAADSSTDFSPVSLTQNDVRTSYTCGSSGIAMVGEGRWGKTQQGTCKMGTNVICIQGVSGSSVTVKGGVRNSGRGCIAAIQIVETEKPVPPVEYGLELSESAAWQSAGWDPSLPETGMTEKDTATVTATGEPTLTLDGTITCGKLVIKSDAGNMLTLKKGAGATTSFGSVDVSAAADGTMWDSTEGFTACSALLNAMRTGNYKFYFLGEGENGATLDYGTEQNNYTFNGHYIFDGGTHTFQNCSESAQLLFGANATVENPTFWVKDGTTLNFKSRNPCGWNAVASNAGIVRIGDGAKVVAQHSADGTWYWSQQFYLEDGATLEIGTTGDNFRTVGLEATNDVSKAHFVVPSGAAAEITGGDNNYLTLPSNAYGAMVFDVEADATLTVSANLKTLANGKPFVKFGAGTLKVTGDVSAFNGAIQVKTGTLELAASSALGANATIAVDAGATLQSTVVEDHPFTKPVSGNGNFVKAGAGTLGVTPGQFGDNVVAITGGKLKFTATSAQAKEGVVLCKAATDISEDVIVVNEAGKELSGDFTFADNTLSFKVNCVDLYLVIDDSSPALWSSLIEGKGWIDSPESTITITNKTTVTFWFDVPITAKSLKIVSASSDDQLGISYEDFANLTIGSYDFSEAVATSGGIAIYCEDAPANTETRIITGATITGFENVVPLDDDIPAGTGFYTDASNIWLCKKFDDVTRTSPTTEDVQAFTNFFVGVKSGDWADKANWRTAKDGLLAPYQYEKYPQSTEAQNPNWYPACFDGAIIDEFGGTKKITCAAVEGWETKLDFRNGVEVTIDHMKKFANNFMWIDNSSSVSITKLGGSSFQYGYIFNVAGQLTIGTFEGNIADIPYTYNLGDEAVVTYTDGIKSGTHAINGGKLVAQGNGIAVPVTITNSVAITTPALAAVTIYPDSTLTLTSSAEGDLAIGGNWTNNGMLDVAAGTVVFKPGVTPGSWTTSGGKVIIGQQVTINDCGKIAVTGEPEDVRLFDAGGEPVTVTKVEGGYAFYDWDVTGKNCWWDYGFNGNLDSVGTDTQTMSEEGTKPYYNEDNTALRVGYGTPYRGATYPEEFTAVIYGKMVNTANQMEIGFGSTYAGTAKGVVIACGDPSKDEVKLLVTSGYGVVETIPMTVTDPYDTDHLYAFTCQTINDGGTDKTKVSLYLDGKFLQAYTFASKVTLGTGFQVGSIHGGSLAGYDKATTANTHADLDFLRVYQTVLNAEAMAKYAEKYPYTSKGGVSERTFDDSLDQTWVAYGITPWTVTPYEQTAYSTNSALAGSQVTVSASADAEVTMNLGATTTYESLTVGEGSAIVFKAGEDAVEPTITGGTTIKTDVMVDYNAIKFGTVEVASGKTLTFDFTDYPFDTYYQTTTIPFTGATSGEGTITATGLPTEGTRTATFVKNASTDQYELKITVDPTTPFIYTIASGAETGTWTFGGEEVTQAIVDANPKVVVWKQGDGSWTNVVLNRTFVIVEGSLVAGQAQNLTSSVTVDGLTTFDMNGKIDGYVTIKLNGGTLVNNGAEMGTGSRQMNGITLTDDSTVGGTGNFGMISSGYAANTLDLGGKVLTKADANTFWLASTTVTNGTLNVVGGGIKVVGNKATTFADDAKLVLAKGTTLDNAVTLNIGAITANGATINNTGTITPFWLSGEATLTGNGTWGTNTLDGATVNVGTKHDFVFAGAGYVNAVLTAAEIASEGPITIFEVEEGLTSVTGGTVKDEDGNVVPGNWAGGRFQVDHEAKIGTTYYLTLQDALEVGGEVVMLKSVTDEYTVPADTVVLLDFNGFAITNNSRQAINNHGTLTITNGNISAKEAAIVFWGNSKTLISGGTYEAKDNAVIMGSGNEGEGNASLVITGGTFNGGIQSAGYIACGVYVPNSGTNTISGATFNIEGGCGVCARAGTTKIDSDVTFNVTGSGEGKVGDKQVLIPAGVDVYFDWSEPLYPGYALGDAILSQVNTLSTATNQEWSAEKTEGYYTLQIKSPIQPVDPSKTDEIECEDADAATVLAAAITLDPASFIKAPAAVTDPEDVAKYQALFCGRAFGKNVYIELNETAKTNLQAEVSTNTVTESVAAALINPSVDTAIINAQTPGLYYWIEGADDVAFEDPALGAAVMATTKGSLELFKPTGLGENGAAFYKICVGTKDPKPPVK